MTEISSVTCLFFYDMLFASNKHSHYISLKKSNFNRIYANIIYCLMKIVKVKVK